MLGIYAEGRLWGRLGPPASDRSWPHCGIRRRCITRCTCCMDNQIDLIRIFTAATQSASFRETATRLGTSPQVVTRAIQQLEERLGETLFHRSTRSVRTRRSGRLLPCARMRSGSWSSDIKLPKYRPQASPSRGTSSSFVTSTTSEVASPPDAVIAPTNSSSSARVQQRRHGRHSCAARRTEQRAL